MSPDEATVSYFEKINQCLILHDQYPEKLRYTHVKEVVTECRASELGNSVDHEVYERDNTDNVRSKANAWIHMSTGNMATYLQ